MKRRFNFKGSHIRIQWNEQAASDPVEVMVYDTVGSDPWGEGGISSNDFKNVLKNIPRDRSLNIRVNSKGGDVHEGMAMRNMLMEWPKPVKTVIDGIAASTSSWAFSPNREGDEVCAYRNSQMFIHDAIAFGFGNADDMRKTADELDKTSDQIAGMYAEKTGIGKRTMRDKMKNETLLTGEEAEEMGLVDTLIDSKEGIRNFKDGELEEMKSKLKSFYNSIAKGGDNQNQNKDQVMKRKLIALLNKHGVTQLNGVTIASTMTDEQVNALNEEQLEAALDKVVNDAKGTPKTQDQGEAFKTLQKQVEDLTTKTNLGRRTTYTNALKEIIADDKVPANQDKSHIERCLKMSEEEAEVYLNELRARSPRPPGGEPLGASGDIECKSEDFKSIQNFILDNGPRFRNKFIGREDTEAGIVMRNSVLRVDETMCKEIRDRAILVGNTISKNKPKIISAWNTNAIDSALQRQVILQDMIEEFAVVLLRLDVFSTVYQNIPLEGTDKVEVPFFPLETEASSTFAKATGYNTISGWTENSREIVVGGDGDTATSGTNAATGTAKDRKYMAINFTSYDIRRQPYLNLQKLFIQAANKLGVDVFTDIVSRVVTLANFGASATAVAAATFSADNVADLTTIATGRNWPEMGRALNLDHTYFGSLLKDPAFKQYLSYGNADAIQRGRIASAYSFDSINNVPNLTNYSPANENLVGWINHKSAVLVATANIMPTEEVRLLMSRFDIVVDPKTGVALAYRRFGDTTLDKTTEVVECSYGAAKGVASALGRITSQ